MLVKLTFYVKNNTNGEDVIICFSIYIVQLLVILHIITLFLKPAIVVYLQPEVTEQH